MVWDRANPVLNKHKIDPGLYPAVVQFLGAGYENLLPGFEIGGGFSGNRGDLGSRSQVISVAGVIRIFCSPSSYFKVSTGPCTLVTWLSTVALVIVLLG
jgi:hypothetical protein